MYVYICRRQGRAVEMEEGLSEVLAMLGSSRDQAARTEFLIALLNSTWRQRHYLDDILGAPAAALGRVRALFNQLVQLLLWTLRCRSSLVV